MIRGSVDVISATEGRGWAYRPGDLEPVLVQAVLNHEILGEAPACNHRADLAAAGLGDGRSGYVIKLRRPVDPLYLPFLSVKVDGGDTELPRAPMLGFAEFFSALYAAHPAAGRHRSVLGGLWTDRTDAAALLRGKSACGQIPQDAAPGLAQLIQNGFALVALAATPQQPEFEANLPGQVLEFLQTGAMLAPLRAILEDNPLVIEIFWQAGETSVFGQPSARNPSPSPAECLEIVVAFGQGVVLDVVRDSHALPEFTPSRRLPLARRGGDGGRRGWVSRPPRTASRPRRDHQPGNDFPGPPRVWHRGVADVVPAGAGNAGETGGGRGEDGTRFGNRRGHVGVSIFTNGWFALLTDLSDPRPRLSFSLGKMGERSK